VPFLANEITTNDICEVHSASTFTWLGRMDDVINSGGVKIYPRLLEGKIRTILKSLNINRDLFVRGFPDSKLGEKIILIIEGSSTSENEIKRALSDALGKFETPKQIIFISTFEKTDSGKINRFKMSNGLNLLN
jgi:O-succinylbenzoic acid--CoA ligase